MIEKQAREDIAFIRRAIEEGGTYACSGSPDMLVWGIALAVGYLGTYAFVLGWSPITRALPCGLVSIAVPLSSTACTRST